MGYPIRFVGSEETIECRSDEPVLLAMDRLGLSPVPVGCRGGGCGVCKVRVVDGRYHTGRMSRAQVSAAEEERGFALACRLYADGPLVVEAVGKGNKTQEEVSRWR